ncbi:TIR domain-containing protein [Tissierella carlieri]|uniref:TIR domain-containing protein n=1 Tax=Tissierella TaxID=41273 RepID=UPI00304DABE0
MRVFLSHSSKDKGHYISKVASIIGKDRIVYDELTFEEGLKSIDEINRTLKISDLFVVFLSENSINSDWVQHELFQAHKLLKEKDKLKQIYPIIIDNRIKHTDHRIPDWLYENNLQLVISPKKAASLILQRLRELSYRQHPRLEEKEKIFVGRNEIIDKIEMRINDFERGVPFAIFASGIQNVGRKKSMYHSLIKTNLIKPSYKLPIIELSSHESIEDLILKIDDLGMTEPVKRDGLLKLTIEEKVKILEIQIRELKDENQRIFIEDNGSIISHDRELVQWFRTLYNKIKDINYLVLGISTKNRIYESYTFQLENIMFVHIPELNKAERGALFYKYSIFEDLNLATDDIKYFVGLLSGFPEQTYYAVRLIKELGLPRAKNETNLIIEYNTERVVKLINEYESDQLAVDILSLLTEYNTIGFNTFFNIIGFTDKNNEILEGLFARGICETFGVNKEYIRLNDIVYDYLIRMNLKLSDEYRQKILNSLDTFIKTQFQEESFTDISEYQYLIKKAIIEKRIDEVKDLLIPSHYLHSMKELYDVHKNYDDVIQLAYRILENDNFIDERISNEIRYYLCMSLARNKDKRFWEEVSYIKGAEYDFLAGFYYRQVGNTEKAIDKYKKAMEKRKPFARAQRDLVQVYLSIEDYETAYKLAKENYEKDKKNNPFHIHAYFNSLIRLASIKNKKDILSQLIEELKINKHENAKEFYYRCKSQFEAFINNDQESALEYINKAFQEFPNNYRILIDKYYICAKFKNISEMENVIETYSDRYNIKDTNHHNIIIKFKVLLFHIKGEYEEIPVAINKLKYYPQEAINKLLNKYYVSDEQIATGKDNN